MSEYAPITKLDFWFTSEDQYFVWPVYAENDRDLEVIAGWTIQFRMAETPNGISILTKNAAIDNPELGDALIFAASADTASLVPKKYHYTLARIDSGFNSVLAHGEAWLQARVA